MNTTIKTTLFVLSTAMAGSLISTQALATDAKTLPGAACEARFGSQTSNFNKTSRNTIWNRSGVRRWVSCPILRDRTINADGFPDMRVYASNPNTICRIYSRSRTGAFHDVQARIGSFMFFNQVNVSSLRGSYNMMCLLPPNGHLRSYIINEFVPTQS
jgi:hypothetical protein